MDLAQRVKDWVVRDDGFLPSGTGLHFSCSWYRRFTAYEEMLCRVFPISRLDFMGASDVDAVRLAAGFVPVPAVGAALLAVPHSADVG